MINHIEAVLQKKASSLEEANPEEKAKINQTVSKNKASNELRNKKLGNLTIGCRKLIIETALTLPLRGLESLGGRWGVLKPP